MNCSVKGDKIMMPIGPLMIEHRLIERMIKQLNEELSIIHTMHEVNPSFIAFASDFFRVYADICHHGKEEHILFGELREKDLPTELRAMMEELTQEHVFARTVVKELLEYNNRYERGDTEALPRIERTLDLLVSFYPMHIEKEDKHFFIPSMEYFTRSEQDHMLEAFNEFDRKLIHELYNEKVMEFEQNSRYKQ
jgi:hemerythrin-like domain-containing protein